MKESNKTSTTILRQHEKIEATTRYELETYFNQLREIISTQSKEIIERLDRICGEKRKAIDSHIKAMDEAAKAYSVLRNFLDLLEKNGSIGDILSFEKTLNTRLDFLAGINLPNFAEDIDLKLSLPRLSFFQEELQKSSIQPLPISVEIFPLGKYARRGFPYFFVVVAKGLAANFDGGVAPFEVLANGGSTVIKIGRNRYQIKITSFNMSFLQVALSYNGQLLPPTPLKVEVVDPYLRLPEVECPFIQIPKPRGVCIDHNDNIIVADTKNQIHKFTSDGEYLLTFGTHRNNFGDLDFPHGVGVDFRNNIYVTDFKNSRLQIFDSNGNFLEAIECPGNPVSISCSPKGEIYLAVRSQGSCTIQCLDEQKNWEVRTFPLGKYYPSGVSVSPSGLVVACCQLYHEVLVNFAEDSKEMRAYNCNQGKEPRLTSIFYDLQGTIFVSDLNNGLKILTPQDHQSSDEGVHQLSIEGIFSVAVDSRGRVIVAKDDGIKILD